MKLLRWLARAVITMFTAAAAWIILAWLMFPAFGLMWNISDSLPLGIYQQVDKPELERGDIVMFCLSGDAAELTKIRHYVPRRWLRTGCEYDLVTLMKPIAGIPSDRITQDASGISVNDVLVPNSVRLDKDGRGEVMPKPTLPAVIPTDNYLLLSPFNPYSWDSRYYSVISKDAVRGVVRPLLTFAYHPSEEK